MNNGEAYALYEACDALAKMTRSFVCKRKAVKNKGILKKAVEEVNGMRKESDTLRAYLKKRNAIIRKYGEEEGNNIVIMPSNKEGMNALKDLYNENSEAVKEYEEYNNGISKFLEETASVNESDLLMFSPENLDIDAREIPEVFIEKLCK